MIRATLVFINFIFIFGFQFSLAATITSSRSIDFSQSLGTNKTTTGSQSINITTIEPKYSLQYEKKKISINADYALVASKDNKNKASDISHRLTLKSTYKHIPNEWSSSFSTRILQKNLSDNGQLVSSSNTTSNAAESYIVNSLSTTRSLHVSSNAKLNTSLSLSSQGFKNQSKTKNAKASAQLNIQRIAPSVGLSSSISTNQNLETKDNSNTFNLTSTYFINAQLNTFLTVTQFGGDKKQFNDTRYQLGLSWDVSSNSRIKLGIGKIGEKNSWSADSFINLRRLSFNLTHSEEVAPANQNLLNNVNNGNSTFNNATSNALKFVKNTTIKVSHNARRLTSSLSLSKNEQFNDLSISSERISRTTTLSFNYKLNRLKSISYSYSNNKIKTTINNQLKQHSVNWSSKISRNSSYNISLDLIEQNSDLSTLDSSKNQLNLNYSLLF